MPFALHGMCSLHSNIATDVHLASLAGYQGLEIHTEKLWRYIDAGFTAEELKLKLEQHNIVPSAIDIIGGVEAPDKASQAKLWQQTQVLCEFAKVIGAPTIQLNAFEGLNGLDLQRNIELTAKNIRSIADIGRDFDIRFQYEGAAWTPIASLDSYFRLYDSVCRDNFGFVLDTWHLWASRGATPEELSKVSEDLIYNVHISDGKRPEINANWPDERELRGYLPGEGDIPLTEYVSAIQSTGYDGFYSGEFLNDQLWEGDYFELAGVMLQQMRSLVNH
ncbi:sugar phosphate isomerase/epimerase [Vibrio sp. S4M6]|uniref:sugar phosphate isomerase/epimerase family protein n=1 Tax=Vibrio sinus TaxID=2946865 RepID=UPI00202A2531|nr:sugar phosphate isomerase/epimerase family protein [Vibrio sinus]MCL9780759.1 sugar phosphate isomerase/epimerase [Vibrio sinus]